MRKKTRASDINFLVSVIDNLFCKISQTSILDKIVRHILHFLCNSHFSFMIYMYSSSEQFAHIRNLFIYAPGILMVGWPYTMFDGVVGKTSSHLTVLWRIVAAFSVPCKHYTMPLEQGGEVIWLFCECKRVWFMKRKYQSYDYISFWVASKLREKKPWCFHP